MIFGLMLKLEISYRLVYNILKDFGFYFYFFKRDFFEDYNFCMVKYLSFHSSSFYLS